MTQFWEPLSDERAEARVKGWGTVPTASLRPAVMDAARRVDRTGRPFEALALLAAACESTSDRSAVAEFAMLAAEVAVNCSKPLTANAAIRLARDSIRDSGGELGPDWCLVQGHALGDLGHVDEAREAYALARDGFAASGDGWGAALVDQNVGAMLVACGEYERALDLLTDAAVVFTEIGDDASLRSCWLSMSTALRCLHRLDETAIVNRRLVDSLRVAGDPMVLGHALVNFGHVHVELDERTAAEECYLEALSLYRQIGLVSDEAICLSSLGSLARADNQLNLALSLQLEAERVFESHHQPADLAIVRYQLAVTSLHLGRWKDAKRYAELATDVAGTDLDPALALSVALTHLGDESGAQRERRGFVERQDEQTLLEEEASLP